MEQFRDGFQAGYQHGAQDARKRHADLLHEHARDVASDFRSGNPRAAYERELEARLQTAGVDVEARKAAGSYAPAGSYAQGGIVPNPKPVELRLTRDGSGALQNVAVEQHLSGRLANVRQAQHGESPSVTGGFSLPQLYVVIDPNNGNVYGASKQQGLNHEEAVTLAAHLDARNTGEALRASIHPLRPASNVR